MRVCAASDASCRCAAPVGVNRSYPGNAKLCPVGNAYDDSSNKISGDDVPQVWRALPGFQRDGRSQGALCEVRRSVPRSCAGETGLAQATSTSEAGARSTAHSRHMPRLPNADVRPSRPGGQVDQVPRLRRTICGAPADHRETEEAARRDEPDLRAPEQPDVGHQDQ